LEEILRVTRSETLDVGDPAGDGLEDAPTANEALLSLAGPPAEG
jgi:hypothetical protein